MPFDRVQSALSSLDVLIVDDHAGMRELLARVLRAAGAASVREAADGASALALLAERPASLILADQHMPGMSGVEFVRQVRSGCAGEAAQIIMLSGAQNDALTDAASAAGVDAMLVKPISPRALLERIATLTSADAA